MEELKLTFVNVGYGEAALLECPDPAFPGGTFVMVIDGGSAEAEEYRDSATGTTFSRLVTNTPARDSK